MATNEHHKQLIQELRKEASNQKAAIWKRVAEDLEKPARIRRIVNISRINRTTKNNETIIVPGKVLGSGEIKHSVIVAALAFSEGAKQTITNAKGQCLEIKDLLKQNPKGKDIRIIG